MKNGFLFLLFACFCSISLGQIHEVGISFGGTNYVGDIGKTSYINPNRPGGAIFYKFNTNLKNVIKPYPKLFFYYEFFLNTKENLLINTEEEILEEKEKEVVEMFKTRRKKKAE